MLANGEPTVSIELSDGAVLSTHCDPATLDAAGKQEALAVLQRLQQQVRRSGGWVSLMPPASLDTATVVWNRCNP